MISKTVEPRCTYKLRYKRIKVFWKFGSINLIKRWSGREKEEGVWYCRVLPFTVGQCPTQIRVHWMYHTMYFWKLFWSLCSLVRFYEYWCKVDRKYSNIFFVSLDGIHAKRRHTVSVSSNFVMRPFMSKQSLRKTHKLASYIFF